MTAENSHAKVTFEFTEYAEDGETLIRSADCQFSAGFNRLAWSNMQWHGKQPSQRQLKLMADIGAAMDELVKSVEQPAIAASPAENVE